MLQKVWFCDSSVQSISMCTLCFKLRTIFPHWRICVIILAEASIEFWCYWRICIINLADASTTTLLDGFLVPTKLFLCLPVQPIGMPFYCCGQFHQHSWANRQYIQVLIFWATFPKLLAIFLHLCLEFSWGSICVNNIDFIIALKPIFTMRFPDKNEKLNKE